VKYFLFVNKSLNFIFSFSFFLIISHLPSVPSPGMGGLGMGFSQTSISFSTSNSFSKILLSLKSCIVLLISISFSVWIFQYSKTYSQTSHKLCFNSSFQSFILVKFVSLTSNIFSNFSSILVIVLLYHLTSSTSLFLYSFFLITNKYLSL